MQAAEESARRALPGGLLHGMGCRAEADGIHPLREGLPTFPLGGLCQKEDQERSDALDLTAKGPFRLIFLQEDTLGLPLSPVPKETKCMVLTTTDSEKREAIAFPGLWIHHH